MANDVNGGTYFGLGITIGMFFITFLLSAVPTTCKPEYHSFTKAICIEDCKYLEDVEIQCNGNTLKQIHPSGFYVPNSKGLNITIDEKTICVRD